MNIYIYNIFLNTKNHSSSAVLILVEYLDIVKGLSSKNNFDNHEYEYILINVVYEHIIQNDYALNNVSNTPTLQAMTFRLSELVDMYVCMWCFN